MGKYYFKHPFNDLSKEQSLKILEAEVFSNDHFLEHVKEVSFKTHIDEEIVKDVLRSYIINIFFMINTVRKIKTKINIYGFFSIFIEKGNRM